MENKQESFLNSIANTGGRFSESDRSKPTMPKVSVMMALVNAGVGASDEKVNQEKKISEETRKKQQNGTLYTQNFTEKQWQDLTSPKNSAK